MGLESRVLLQGFGGSGFRVQGSESRVGGSINKKLEGTLWSLGHVGPPLKDLSPASLGYWVEHIVTSFLVVSISIVTLTYF